ncbi:hypothetical protein TESG_05510 [Trichophyton tonsurans CBS 112818]|uniref:Uncharacterized protein n=1 Tax=Trichophyton tonsurans (strain CBS 112818) TaxID=647933 RepID=F2S3H4_TRIT1|nr:hypothetical protein TESG_05510 [Trichophyton tonsurans CBS 112818]
MLPPQDESKTELDHWVVKLINKGIPEKDIETVHVALNPDLNNGPVHSSFWSMAVYKALESDCEPGLRGHGAYDSPQRPSMLPIQSLVDEKDNGKQSAARIMVKIKTQ